MEYKTENQRQDIKTLMSSSASHSAGPHILRILGKAAMQARTLNTERVTYQQKTLT